MTPSDQNQASLMGERISELIRKQTKMLSDLYDFGKQLNTCKNLDDIISIAQTNMTLLLPNCTIGILMLGNSQHMKKTFNWGSDTNEGQLTANATTCIGIQSLSVHTTLLFPGETNSCCKHIAQITGIHICAPITNGVNVFGSIYFMPNSKQNDYDFLSAKAGVIAQILASSLQKFKTELENLAVQP